MKRDTIASEKSPARQALERANGWYAAAAGLVEVGKVARGHYRSRHSYAITVSSDDAMYQDVNDWLLGNVPTENQRKLAAHSTAGGRDWDEILPSSAEVPAPRLYLTYDSSHEQTIVIDGHRVKVALDIVADADQRKYGFAKDKITFTATSLVGQRAVRDHLERIAVERQQVKKRPTLWMLNHWGSWQKRSDLPARTLDSVVLRAGQLESLAADLADFLQREADYIRRGIPWHRGYLLQGPPGTGKTSVAKALANAHGLDLWYAPLGDINKDTNLLTLLNEVNPRSMLLLEDVDIYHASRSREAESNQLTLSGLLNALDGVATPHGLVTVLTSNEPQVLDAALVRPGRVDVITDLDYVTHEQAARLFTYFYGRPPSSGLRIEARTTTAALGELFKRHMDDPLTAEAVLARG